MHASSSARQALALAAAGRAGEALRLLEPEAASGDPEALFVRGLWRLEGTLLPRDVAGAAADIELAAERGHQAAARIHAGFLATGTGRPRDWPGAVAVLDHWADHDPLAARQRQLIGAMALTSAGDPTAAPERETLSTTPEVARYPGLFTVDECRLLVELAEPRFRPALIFHEAQRRFVRDPVRDSDAAGFPLVSEWPFVHALNRRIALASGTHVAQGETLQVLRYRPGQQYRPHLDAIAGLANQRQLTMIVYLTDGYEGGETEFLESGLKAKGALGHGLLFVNALADGRPDPATRHAGCPVRSGEKLIASRWIRTRAPDDPAEGFGQHEAERRT